MYAAVCERPRPRHYRMGKDHVQMRSVVLACQTAIVDSKAKLSYDEQACWASPELCWLCTLTVALAASVWAVSGHPIVGSHIARARRALPAVRERLPLLDTSGLASKGGQRSAWVDNAKFWLQTLVVAKHMSVFWGHTRYFPQAAINGYCETFFMQVIPPARFPRSRISPVRAYRT